ncbi:dipeptidase [Bacillus salitolerans]|uniref:Dipeptidase n=1 Tax=Bacillus salitolerans TaxID=1437434 RepID=A0ABW4LVH3_9BACI
MNNNVKVYLSEQRDRQLEELTEFLKIPSVSSLSEHTKDVESCANWISNSLSEAGMQNVKVMPTKRHPVVYGEWLGAEGKPTVLIYGHYDVQPVDPLHLWETPPFEPMIRDEKIYARGASDDKGQVFMHIKAIEAIMKTTDSLPVNVKFLIEGEEEIGSPNLPDFIEEHKEMLAADVLLISDTALYAKGEPAICYALRGLAGVQIDVKGPKRDLHSGAFGGGVPNPAKQLVDLIASFHDDNFQIRVEGFYDKVRALTEEEREAYRALQFDEEKVKKDLELSELVGEEGYTFLERVSGRPTLEINGIYGGFQGEGIKTVIPAEAHAKITCRLVPNQDPDEIIQLIEKHIQKNKPAGVEVTVTPFDKGHPFITPFDHPAIQAAAKSYEEEYGVPTKFIREGGSIPIVAVFDQILKTPVVLMGFGLESENIHSPNEHFHLENFDKGLAVICDYLFRLSDSL